MYIIIHREYEYFKNPNISKEYKILDSLLKTLEKPNIEWEHNINFKTFPIAYRGASVTKFKVGSKVYQAVLIYPSVYNLKGDKEILRLDVYENLSPGRLKTFHYLDGEGLLKSYEEPISSDGSINSLYKKFVKECEETDRKKLEDEKENIKKREKEHEQKVELFSNDILKINT